MSIAASLSSVLICFLNLPARESLTLNRSLRAETARDARDGRRMNDVNQRAAVVVVHRARMSLTDGGVRRLSQSLQRTRLRRQWPHRADSRHTA